MFQWHQRDCAVRVVLAHTLGKGPESIRAHSKSETFQGLKKELKLIRVLHTGAALHVAGPASVFCLFPWG